MAIHQRPPGAPVYPAGVPARIVLYTPSHVAGGAERMMLRLAAGYRERGQDVLVMTERRDVFEPLASEGRFASVPIESADRAGVVGFEARLAMRLRQLRPDVFHLHRGWPVPGTAALLAAAIARVPAIIVSEHLWIPPMRRARLVNRALRRAVTRYIAVSADLADHLRVDLGIAPRQISLIHNGIDIDSSRAGSVPDVEASLPSPRPPVVFTAARLGPQKGIPVLIEAAARLPDVWFLVAGEGQERERLDKLAVDLRVSDRVVFLGQRSDVRSLLPQADLFALPSRFEGLPISILEAMAARTPIVASDLPGTREAVGDFALLFPPGDARALALAIRTLLDDRPRAARLAEGAYARVTTLFTADRMVDETLALYETVR